MTSPSQGRGSRVAAVVALLVAGSALAGLDGPARAQDSAPVAPVTWSAQLRSTAYFSEAAPPGSTEVESRAPFYENLYLGVGNLADGRLDLRFSGRYADDAQFENAFDEHDKWFTGYARLRLDPWRTRIRAGRQFIQEGTVFSTLDGAWVALQPHRRLAVHGWAGSTAPNDRQFEFSDDFRYGGRAMWRAHPRVRLDGWAERRVEDDNTLSWPVGGQVLLRPMNTMRALARGSVDIDREELDRVDLMVNWQPRPEWPVFDVQYLARSQEYESGSWWEQFGEELHAVQLVRGTARWTNERGVGGELQGFGSFVDERRTGQVGAAVIAPHLRLGVGVLGGDATQQFRIYGDIDYVFLDRVDVAAGANFVEYALVEDPTSAEKRELTSYFARAAWEFVPGARLSTELQVLDNPVYDSDVRLLVGLDLFAGRGASRYGLGSGGVH